MDTESAVVDAFAQLGIEARLVDAPERKVGLVLDPDGVGIRLQLGYRSLVTDDVAKQIISGAVATDAVLLVVADRVTEGARHVLTSSGAGYLDLRGRLALRASRLVIDADVEPLKKRTQRSEALTGRAGLEVAAALLMHPNRRAAVRGLARELGRAPSTVSEVLAGLRRDGLVDRDNVVVGTDLFWQVADRWSDGRIHIRRLPSPGDLTEPLRLGLDDPEHEPGWALTDSAAAVAYGAPLAFRSDQVLDFLVPDQTIVRRASTLLGAAVSTSYARATVRVAPVPAAVESRVDLEASISDWPLAHPLFVALDLAQDIGRGREILDAWTPGERWSRVW